jgi:choline dehydrogenase
MRTLLLHTLVIFGASLVGTAPSLQSTDQEIKKVYHADYVVVGVGTAGAGIAKLLSDNPKNSVIALDAGRQQDNDPPIRDSFRANDLEPFYYATYFYQQEQQPEPFNGMQYHYTTGYLWGGGSSINGEQYVQGTNQNFQQWQNLLGSSWSVHKIRKAYKALEKYNGSTTNPAARGFKGPVDIRQAPTNPTAMALKFANAVTLATGFSEILDYNDPNTPLGPFTRWQLYQDPSGIRENSSRAYLKDILKAKKDRKLRILSKATALRILFNQHRKAIGVLVEKEGTLCKVLAKKKVILSAGIFSPKLLMLSGIGPKKLLQSQGIDPVFVNPNVGKSLVNHALITAVFTANPQDIGIPANDPNALYTGGAFLPDPTPGSDQTRRDVQLIGMSPAQGTFAVTVLLLDPKSRGQVKIQSNDAFKPVLASDAILSDPADLNAFKNIFKVYIANIATQLATIDPSYQLVSPTMDIINNDALLTDFIMANVNIPHHWTGSCRMAPRSQGGVVDQHAHVYGVKNLVVADTSIVPFPNDGNTSAPSFMLARVIAKQLERSK